MSQRQASGYARPVELTAATCGLLCLCLLLRLDRFDQRANLLGRQILPRSGKVGVNWIAREDHMQHGVWTRVTGREGGLLHGHVCGNR